MKSLYVTFLLVLAAVTTATVGWAADYRYITPDEMNARLAAKTETVIIDICDAEQFAKGHLPGAIETNAYPVKSDEDRAKLDKTLDPIKTTEATVVVVCPGGKGGAKRTVDYLLSKGVAVDRLYILEGGMNGWPHQTVAAD